MTIREAITTMETFAKLDITQMDFMDQLECMTALNEAAEKLRPLVVKYANKLPEKETFLLKLGK